MFYTVINAAPQCNAKHEAIKILIDIVSLKIILAAQQVEIENIDPISHFKLFLDENITSKIMEVKLHIIIVPNFNVDLTI